MVMQFICLTNPNEKPNRYAAAKEYFDSIGINPIYLNCLHGGISGLTTQHIWGEHGVDRISPTKVGIWLAHYMAWNAAWACGADKICIIEDDALFCQGWERRMFFAEARCPDNWDIIRLSQSGTDMDRAVFVADNLFRCPVSFSMIGYVVRRKAIPFLLETQRKVVMPMDHSMLKRSFEKLLIYTAIPSIVTQDNGRWKMDQPGLQEAT